MGVLALLDGPAFNTERVILYSKIGKTIEEGTVG